MNKLVIKKHGPVIKWFCDNADKGIWCKLLKDDYWVHCDGVSFELKNKYVQNDEYAELRKAKADGKTIQFDDPMDEQKWSDLLEPFEFLDDVNMFRIKPDEPEFKIGDWVYPPNRNTPIQVKKDMFGQSYTNWKIWKPQEGEWVCMKDFDLDNVYAIFKYNSNRIPKEIYPLDFIQTLKEN